MFWERWTFPSIDIPGWIGRKNARVACVVSGSARMEPSYERRKTMRTIPEKTSIVVAPALNKQTGRARLNFVLVILQAATIASLFTDADGIHCIGGLLLLAACGLHLLGHASWIKSVMLNRSNNIPSTVRRRCWLFWAMLSSGLLCGWSGLHILLSDEIFTPTPHHVARIHAISGFIFISLSICHLVSHRNWFLKRIGTFFRAL